MERVAPLDPVDFYAKMREINDLYIEVKEVIILAENFDPTHEVYLSPLNELRNSYDHLMRIITYPEKWQNEFDEAKEHLYRAGYDAYEVLAINVSDAILKIVEAYHSSVIATIFPGYYQDIQPLIMQLRVELAGERAHKRLDPETGTKSFNPYKEKVVEPIKHLKICEQNIPLLEGEISKNKKQALRKTITNTIGGIIIGIIITILGTWAYDKFVKNETPSPKPVEKNIVAPKNSKADSAHR